MARTAAVFAAAVALVAATLSARAEPLANACSGPMRRRHSTIASRSTSASSNSKSTTTPAPAPMTAISIKVLDEAKRYVEMRGGAGYANPPSCLTSTRPSLSESCRSNWSTISPFIHRHPLQDAPTAERRLADSTTGSRSRAPSAIDGTLRLVQRGESARRGGVLHHRPPREPRAQRTVTNLNAVGYEGWTGISLRPRTRQADRHRIQVERAR